MRRVRFSACHIENDWASTALDAAHRRRGSPTDSLQFVSKVFWFSLEFVVVRERGEERTYGETADGRAVPAVRGL